MICFSCHAAHYLADDELELLEDNDEDSDTGLEFNNARREELAYAEYEQACAEWDNMDLPEAIEGVYRVFLGAAHQRKRFRRQGR